MATRRQPPWSRQRLLHALQQNLEHRSWPRLQMMLLVALTGAAGLLASFALLQAGVLAMWLRYPLALGCAYLVFLGLLWLWLRTSAADYLDMPVAGTDIGPGGTATSTGLPAPVSGDGGDFAGGGASAGFDGPAPTASSQAFASPSSTTSASSSSSWSDGLPSVADADEFAIPLAVLALAAGLALSSLYIVYVAPALFAELLLDGVLAATLYRRLRGIESRHWIRSALRRTAGPFALTALFLTLCGAAMQGYAPQAHSLGDVLRHAAARP